MFTDCAFHGFGVAIVLVLAPFGVIAPVFIAFCCVYGQLVAF